MEPSNVRKKVRESPNVRKELSHVILELSNVRMKLSNVRKELSHVMLELHNVRMEPSNVRKKVRKLPNMRK